MDIRDVMAMWPLFLGFITLVVVLAKMHAELHTLTDKLKALFDLWNSKHN